MQRDSSSPEAYRQSVEGEQAELLEEIRSLILLAHPNTSEEIEYGMLSYRGVAHLAAQKHYVSIYMDPRLLEPYREQLPADCGKSCIRYRRLDQFEPAVLLEILQSVDSGTPAHNS